MNRLLAVLAGVLLISLMGCSREPLVSPTAPQVDAPPDSIERCATIRVATIIQSTTNLSVTRPRVQSVEVIDVPERNTVTSLVTVVNEAGSDAALVRFLETLSGRPYARYYYRTAAGDTLLRPNPTNGSESSFELSAVGVPSSQYRDVALYKGSITTPNGALSVTGPTGTTWYTGISWTTWVDREDCYMVPITP